MNYRIGILTDSDFLKAWEWECIHALIQQGDSEIVLEIRNLSPKPSGKKSPFLYRLYRTLDRRLFKSAHDAFQQIPISNLPIGVIPQLEVYPVQSKYKDEISTVDLDRIKAFKLDILLRFGFRILTGEILKLPRLGVWSYHHGDPTRYRGGPPAFWEVMLGWECTGTVLQRLSEELDSGDILYQSWSQTDPLSVQRNANNIFWKSSYFVARVLNQIQLEGEGKWQQKLRYAKSKQSIKSDLKRPPAALELLSLLWQLIARNSVRKIQEKRKPAHWELALVNHSDPSAINPSDVHLIAHSNITTSYLADPFPVLHGEETYVFAEQYDKKSKKGIIICGRLVDNKLRDLQPVIQEDWHLSYPFIFEENGIFFMIPESAEKGKLTIYEAFDFPLHWRKRAVFFEEEAYDPTLYFSNGTYWLFVNQKPHAASSSFDELNLYFSDSLHTGKWQAHPLNPIVSDVRCSRPAGNLFESNGKLFRPAQDSGKRYGHRIVIQEILEMTETSYKEKVAQFLEPDLVNEALGVHTLNFSGDKMYLDFYFRK